MWYEQSDGAITATVIDTDGAGMVTGDIGDADTGDADTGRNQIKSVGGFVS
jgi:hypothetical protein